jgi:hypothetical protein
VSDGAPGGVRDDSVDDEAVGDCSEPQPTRMAAVPTTVTDLRKAFTILQFLGGSQSTVSSLGRSPKTNAGVFDDPESGERRST